MAPWLFPEPNLYSKYKIVFTGNMEKNRLQALLAFITGSPMDTGNSGTVNRKSVNISMGNLTLICMNIF